MIIGCTCSVGNWNTKNPQKDRSESIFGMARPCNWRQCLMAWCTCNAAPEDRIYSICTNDRWSLQISNKTNLKNYVERHWHFALSEEFGWAYLYLYSSIILWVVVMCVPPSQRKAYVLNGRSINNLFFRKKLKPKLKYAFHCLLKTLTYKYMCVCVLRELIVVDPGFISSGLDSSHFGCHMSYIGNDLTYAR